MYIQSTLRSHSLNARLSGPKASRRAKEDGAGLPVDNVQLSDAKGDARRLGTGLIIGSMVGFALTAGLGLTGGTAGALVGPTIVSTMAGFSGLGLVLVGSTSY